MASLAPPFILCPLPDRKALLGIRPDCLQNKAIVTLGKNIAIRYHVPEQKQESSWTTSRYWFTSPVTYCYDCGKYGAVLNHHIIALWDEADATLANISKIKLQENVFGLHSNPNGRTVIVMKNGSVAYLEDAADNKDLVKNTLLQPKEEIVSFELHESSNNCYLATKKDTLGKQVSIVQISLLNGPTVSKRWEIGNSEDSLMGFCFLISESSKHLVYFSSDGFIYKLKLQKNNKESSGLKLANLGKYVSNRNPVIMCPLQDKSSIAIYGCDPSEEGAVVVIYDIHYDLIVSKQSLKLYSMPPLMEKIDQTLFVPLGLHILVLGFRISKSLLSSVVGKHQARLDEEVFEGRNPWITVGWDPDSELRNEVATQESKSKKDAELLAIKQTYPTIWETIQQVRIFESEGQPEAVICNHVIPAAIEKENVAALDWILDTFVDIPETHIVGMTVFALQRTCDGSGSNEQLNRVLLRKFDKHLLTLTLRHVNYDVVKHLLGYLSTLIKTQWQLDTEYEDNDSMKSWLKWCSALVDAHYTKFVIHSETSIIDALLDTMCECTKVMEAVAEVEPFLALTYSKVSFEPSANPLNRWRTETVTFE